MAETQWEKLIDTMLKENTEVLFHVVSKEGKPTLAGSRLVRNHNYAMTFGVKNIGPKVHFARIQALITAKPAVQLYTDDTFGTPTDRVRLEWEDIAPGQEVTGTIPFRVTADISNADIVHYDLYAVIVPQGHVWKTLNWPGDLNRPR